MKQSENMEYPPAYIQQEDQPLIVTTESKRHLNSIANWGRVLAIAGFFGIFAVVIGIYILGLIVKNAGNVTPESEFETLLGVALVTIPLIVIAVFYFYALYKMLMFSSAIKDAIRTNNSEVLSNAFSLLKSHYKSLAIMLIVTVIYYMVASVVIGIITAYGMEKLMNF